MFVTFVIGTDFEDIAAYMNDNPELIQGQPILVPDVTKLLNVDQMDLHFIFLKTPAYWESPYVHKREQILMELKRENYKGPIFFVNVDDVIIPCMRFQMQMTSLPVEEIEDWPDAVEPEMCCQVTLTTMVGQRYTVYSGNVNLLSFCGKNKALVIGHPMSYTGGFA